MKKVLTFIIILTMLLSTACSIKIPDDINAYNLFYSNFKVVKEYQSEEAKQKYIQVKEDFSNHEYLNVLIQNYEQTKSKIKLTQSSIIKFDLMENYYYEHNFEVDYDYYLIIHGNKARQNQNNLVSDLSEYIPDDLKTFFYDSNQYFLSPDILKFNKMNLLENDHLLIEYGLSASTIEATYRIVIHQEKMIYYGYKYKNEYNLIIYGDVTFSYQEVEIELPDWF